MSSFKEKLSKSGQKVLDERALILFQRAKIEYALAMKVDAEEFPTKDNEGTEINLDEIDLNK